MSAVQTPTQSDWVGGFILSRQWRDLKSETGFGQLKQLELIFWLQTSIGPVRAAIPAQKPVFFLASSEAERASSLLKNVLGNSASHPAFIPAWEIKPLNLKSFNQESVVGVYFREQRSLIKARNALASAGLDPLEGDIQPYDRYLMERFIAGGAELQGDWEKKEGFWSVRSAQLRPSSYQPVVKTVSLDIETSMDGQSLYCIGATLQSGSSPVENERLSLGIVFMISDDELSGDTGFEIVRCRDESDLLQQFLDWFNDVDPDIIIGWNVINFDLRVLQNKADELGVPLRMGRAKSFLDWRATRGEDDHFTLVTPGRAVLCGIDTLKSATYHFESFALDEVARELLDRGKLTDDVDNRGVKITEQFHQDKLSLARYNIEDCRLVEDIFEATQLIEFAKVRSRITGLSLDRFGGSVAAFDHRYLPRLHRRGYVAPSLVENPVGVGSPGGYVMDSIPGLYRDVLVLDFKSLYPSIIRTFKIDPLARVSGISIETQQGKGEREPVWNQQESIDVDLTSMVPGYNDAIFAKEDAILPEIIGELWLERDAAKRENNSALSQAIKIIMNSFYGVLGTPGCRFFDYRLPSSITLRGHSVLTESVEWLEDQGLQVIYGDTDSVFVLLQDKKLAGNRVAIHEFGKDLANRLNQWWQSRLKETYDLQSYLEIEFETHYQRFVMPKIRNSEQGSKKRYAGLLTRGGDQELVFKGLEAVRSDWTTLARRFQRELYRRVFFDLDYDDYIRSIVAELREGKFDHELVYRKRIRRSLGEYQRNVPPHVVAARMAETWLESQNLPSRYERGGWVRYVYTINGPQPCECIESPLDYERYIERQIKPVADGLLHLLSRSFDEITDFQLGLFAR